MTHRAGNADQKTPSRALFAHVCTRGLSSRPAHFASIFLLLDHDCDDQYANNLPRRYTRPHQCRVQKGAAKTYQVDPEQA